MRRYLTNVLMVFSRLLPKACQRRSRVAQRLTVQDSVRVVPFLAPVFLDRLQDFLTRSILIRADPLGRRRRVCQRTASTDRRLASQERRVLILYENLTSLNAK